jgi:hypothetical protein
MNEEWLELRWGHTVDHKMATVHGIFCMIPRLNSNQNFVCAFHRFLFQNIIHHYCPVLYTKAVCMCGSMFCERLCHTCSCSPSSQLTSYGTHTVYRWRCLVWSTLAMQHSKHSCDIGLSNTYLMTHMQINTNSYLLNAENSIIHSLPNLL